MKTNPSDSAYPTPEYYDEKQVGCSEGLTKREYFAAIALQGLISRNSRSETHDFLASQSVRLADALITELNKTI